MRERKPFNLFRAIKEAFTPKNRKQESPVKLKAKSAPVRRRGQRKAQSAFSQSISLPFGTPKLFRKMARARANETNLKRVQTIGVIRRLAAMEQAEKVTPGKYTRAIREHREWLAVRK